MSTLMWITEKELKREIKSKGDEFRCKNNKNFINPRANGRNIFAQKLPALVDVASVCTLPCMLMLVVGSCFTKFETGQTF